MSELKHYKLFHRASALTSPEFISVVEFGPNEEVYLKSDVDLLLDEKDAEIESLKASHDTEMVDAGMRELKLRRALYKARANWALSTLAWLDCIDQGEPRKWSEMRQKCLAKMEEFK